LYTLFKYKELLPLLDWVQAKPEHTLLVSRWWWSTFAYQEQPEFKDRDLDYLDFLIMLHKELDTMLQPTYLYLMASIECMLSRVAKRNDHYPKKSLQRWQDRYTILVDHYHKTSPYPIKRLYTEPMSEVQLSTWANKFYETLL
jgi:thymidylate kinase